MSALSCVPNPDNLSLTKCTKLPELIAGMFETPSNFYFSAANAVLSAQWQTALLAVKANRIYMWPPFANFTDNSEKQIYEVTPLQDIPVRDGKYKFEIEIKKDLCLHKAMFTHRSINSGGIYFYDNNQQIIGTLDASGNVRPFTKALLWTEKMMFNNGTVASKTPIHLVLATASELDQNGVMIDASSFLNTLVPLSDVVITVITGSIVSPYPTMKVQVVNACDNTPVTGLVVGDFVVLTTAGASQALTSRTDNGDGTYILTGSSDFVPGNVNLVSAATLSLTGYESLGAAVFTTPE